MIAKDSQITWISNRKASGKHGRLMEMHRWDSLSCRSFGWRNLVGGFNLPFWNIWVSWDDEIPNWMDKKQHNVPNHQPDNFRRNSIFPSPLSAFDFPSGCTSWGNDHPVQPWLGVILSHLTEETRRPKFRTASNGVQKNTAYVPTFVDSCYILRYFDIPRTRTATPSLGEFDYGIALTAQNTTYKSVSHTIYGMIIPCLTIYW